MQYAHQNLVIHRDLKPANILVDADGEPKLLDCGIAKLLAGIDVNDPAGATLVPALTPDYASPEQVRGQTVTTATDVYSLEPETSHGGEDAPNGRGLRYLQWSWDPNPNDTTFDVAYAFLLRDAGGSVRVEGDRHVEGLFSRTAWLTYLREAGFDASSRFDPWQRDVFAGRRMPV